MQSAEMILISFLVFAGDYSISQFALNAALISDKLYVPYKIRV